jgi:hypothetical protein
MQRSDKANEIHLRLLAEAASDALDRNVASRDFMAKAADLRREAVHVPRLRDWLRKRLIGNHR